MQPKPNGSFSTLQPFAWEASWEPQRKEKGAGLEEAMPGVQGLLNERMCDHPSCHPLPGEAPLGLLASGSLLTTPVPTPAYHLRASVSLCVKCGGGAGEGGASVTRGLNEIDSV